MKVKPTPVNYILLVGVALLFFDVTLKTAIFFGKVYGLLWTEILDLFGNNPKFLFTVGTMASLGLPFWLTNLFFMSLDLWGKPKFLRDFKIQEDKNAPVDWKMYKKCIKVININQVVATIFILMIYPITEWRGMPYKLEDIPTFPKFLAQMIYFAIVQEFAFFYLHRLMHHPYLYKRIHKVHHEWTAPISLAVVYVHPIEHIVVNMIPIMFSPILIGAHLSSSWIWYVIATWISTIHHSGYHFPMMPSPEFHDYHHLKFNQCFGVIGFLDWFHGTDIQYRESKNFKNDKVYFSTMPVWGVKNE